MTDRISEAVANVVTATTTTTSSTSPSFSNNGDNDDSHRIAQLSAMGFEPAEARHALYLSSGDMQRASEWLLANGTPIGIITAGNNNYNHPPTTTSTAFGANNTITEMVQEDDDDIQRAIQASLEEEELQHQLQQQLQSQSLETTNSHHPNNPKRNTKRNEWMTSAAAKRAGHAALQRFENQAIGTTTKPTTSTTKSTGSNSAGRTIASHPNVHIPKRLSQHDKEEIIMRCTSRIASYPSAVDTLLRSLKTIQAHPNNIKYQTIDTSTATFQKSLNKPGVLDFLRAMNFQNLSRAHPTKLKLSILDPATFFLGISALEQVQQTSPDYANNKVLMKFDQEIADALALGDVDMTEALKRSQFMSQCPSESLRSTAGSQVTVELGSSHKVTRKFDADDTIQDVIHWLGSHSSMIPYKLLESKEWHLVDRNDPHSRVIVLTTDNIHNNNNNGLSFVGGEDQSGMVLDRTLQYIGCWPSGRLAVVPTLPHPISLLTPSTTNGPITIKASSRGLGAGPVDH